MDLLQSLQDKNNTKEQPKPILLKIAPDLTDSQLMDIIDIVNTTKIAGVIATNTTIARDGLSSEHKEETGGLSGGVDEAVVVLAEAWEAPTRALGQLLGGLRAQADSRTTFVVLLIDADEENAAVWRRYVAGLGDPYLFVDDGLDNGREEADA